MKYLKLFIHYYQLVNNIKKAFSFVNHLRLTVCTKLIIQVFITCKKGNIVTYGYTQNSHKNI